MASLLDLIRSASGQPDINQQIATALGQAPGQPGSSQGPQPGAGPAAAPPGAAGPQPGDGGAPQAPPQPQAYQSQPDMAQLYFKFAQQQHADDMFNRGIAGIAAGFAPSWDRNAILGMGRDTSMDAGSTFGNLVKLQQYGQQQQQYQAWQRAVTDPATAQQFGVTPQTLQALGPEGFQRLEEQRLAVPDAARTYDYFGSKYASEHAGDLGSDGQPIGAAGARKQFEADHPIDTFMAASMPGANLNPVRIVRMQALQQWMQENKGQTPPDYLNDDQLFTAHTASIGRKQDDQDIARGNYGAYSSALNSIRAPAAILNDPKNAEDLKAVLAFQPPTINGVRQGGYAGMIAGALGGKVTDNQAAIIRAIDDLTGYNLAGVKAASPRQAQELAPIEANFPQLSRFGAGSNVSPQRYQGIVKDTVDAIDSARANAAAASGQLDVVASDPKLAPLVNDSYLPGGVNFLGHPKRLAPADIAEAKQEIAKGADRQDVIRALKLQGYLPRAGEI